MKHNIMTSSNANGRVVSPGPSSMVNSEANTYQVIRLNHSNRLVSALESMLYEEMLCDVTIVTNGQMVKAHQVILSATSAYFKEIFHATPIGFNPIVFLKNFTNEDINDILEFIYKGELVVPYHRLESLVESAKSLGIAGLSTLRLSQDEPDESCQTKNQTSTGTNDDSMVSEVQPNKDNTTITSTMTDSYRWRKRGRKRKIASSQTRQLTNDLRRQEKDNADDPNHHLNRNDSQIDKMGGQNSAASSKSLDVKLESEHCDGLLEAKNLRNRINTLNNVDPVVTNGFTSTTNKQKDAFNAAIDHCSDSGSQTSISCKITKSKLRSWSQQIMQKNLAARKLSSSSTETCNSAKTVVAENQQSVSVGDVIKLESRPRGRPRKIINVPRLSPLLGPGSTKTNTNSLGDEVNLNGHINDVPVKRGRGRPPLYQRDPKIASTVLPDTKLFLNSKSSCVSLNSTDNPPMFKTEPSNTVSLCDPNGTLSTSTTQQVVVADASSD